MMRRIPVVLLGIFMLTAGVKLQGQQKSGAKQPEKVKPFLPPVYLGESNFKGGLIAKDQFNAYLRQGLSSYDSLGNHYKIVGFDFTYAERKVYEDSIGNLIKITDLLSEHYPGNVIGADLSTDADLTADPDALPSVYQRIKAGDTVYFDHIVVNTIGKNSLVRVADTVPSLAQGFRCVITK